MPIGGENSVRKDLIKQIIIDRGLNIIYEWVHLGIVDNNKADTNAKKIRP